MSGSLLAAECTEEALGSMLRVAAQDRARCPAAALLPQVLSEVLPWPWEVE